MKIDLTDAAEDIKRVLEENSQEYGLYSDPSGKKLILKKSDVFSVENSTDIVINYTEKCEIYRGVALICRGGHNAVFRKRNAEVLALMVDCSRNAALNMKSLKRLVRLLARMGYNQLQLYTEDTLEVEGQPYFGHLRGRYTAAEVKELDAYCAVHGIELVPCIQTLAHLNAMFKWEDYAPVNDCEDILLARKDETYELIEDIIRSASAMFSSKKINIGMDESALLGAGKFHDTYGYAHRHEIIIEHLERVNSICKKYNFSPMMWSDMFFRFYNKGEYHLSAEDKFLPPPEVTDNIPGNIALIYWDYYRNESASYLNMIRMHYAFKNEIYFAGGAWRWSGFAPFNRQGMIRARAAIDALKLSTIKNVIVTSWADNGGECSVFATLPQLAVYGAYKYDLDTGDAGLTEEMNVYCGAVYDDFINLGLPDELYSTTVYSNISKCFFYNDILLGKCDYYAKGEHPAKYHESAKILNEAKHRNPQFAYLFSAMTDFCLALEKKCFFGVKLKEAYTALDFKLLKSIAKSELPELTAKIKTFQNSFKSMWNIDNKTFGREIIDIRIAGVLARIDAASEAIFDFVGGKINKIEELEQPRLPVRADDNGILYLHRYDQIASASIFTRLM